MQVSKAHHNEVERRSAGLSIHHSQHRMLLCISNMPDAASQKQLAKEMGISPAAATIILKSLDKAGYVTRTAMEEDNRRNQVVITEKGKNKLAEVRESFDSIDQAMFQGMTEADIQKLKNLLTRMRDNLEEMTPAPATEEGGSLEDTTQG
jgi:DNA-binding MarR family transcriptional regulator